jgi:hypothetical protein
MIEADQEEGRDGGQLPEYEEQDDMIGSYQAEHRQHEGEQQDLQSALIRVMF